jgi:hypothetical protein
VSQRITEILLDFPVALSGKDWTSENRFYQTKAKNKETRKNYEVLGGAAISQ